MRCSTALLALTLVVACGDPPPPIEESRAPADAPASAQLPPPSNGIAGRGPDQAPLPEPEPASAPAKTDSAKPLDPAAPDPKTGSSAKCNSGSTFSISDWKKIDGEKKLVDFDVVSNVEGSVTLLDHETDAVIEADAAIEIDPIEGGKPEGSFRGIAAVSGQRLLMRADWGDCLVVVVP